MADESDPVEQFLNRTAPVTAAPSPPAPPSATAPAPATSPATTPAADPVETFLYKTAPVAPPPPAGGSATVPPPTTTTSMPPPATFLTDPTGAAVRIGQAAEQGWQSSPSFWTPQGRNLLENAGVLTPFTSGIIEPAGNLVSGALAAGSALLRGGQQTVQEVFNPLNPLLGTNFSRDVAAIPEAFGGDVRGMDATELLNAARQRPTYSGAATSADADAVASGHFAITDTDNTTLSPDTINRALDSLQPSTPRELARAQTTGRNVVTDQLDRLEEFRNQPMTVQQWQGVNEGLTAAIRNEYKPGGMSSEGVQLMKIQKQLRDQIQNAGDNDIVAGSGAGLDALKQGNAAYSQARKMQTVEDMWDYAKQTPNATSSMQRQVATFTKSDAKTAGWSDEEIAGLKDAANRGNFGNVLHFLSNKVVLPVIGAAAGARGGVVGAIAGAGTSYALGEGARAIENYFMARRINALTGGTMGQAVPPPANPLQYQSPPQP